MAIVLAYYVAMAFDWFSPTWVAISVAMISLGSVGQSLAKGVLRAKGTFVAFFASLFFLSLFSQDRWLMLLSLSVFIAFVTYKMTGKNGQYAWFVTGFVTLMIISSSGQSTAHVFEFAAYRTMETLSGIVIWALVSVFIWPQSNTHTLHKLSQQLIQAEQKLFSIYHAKLMGQDVESDFQPAHDTAVQSLNQLDQAIDAANFESLEVRDRYQHWEKRKQLSLGYIAILARLDSGLADIKGINIHAVLPGLEPYLTDLDHMFSEALAVPEGEAHCLTLTTVTLPVDEKKLHGVDYFQRAAIEVLRNDLERCAAFVVSLLNPVDKGVDSAVEAEFTARHPVGPLGLVPLDPDRIRGAVFVVASLWAGALLWIYVNPPGHASWLQLLPTVALVWAQAPYMKLPVIKLFAIIYLVFMPVYVLVMPELSVFWELGILLFIICFVMIFFLSGVTVSVAYLAMFGMLGISNEQSYNFAAMMNSYAFTVLAMIVVTMLSYIMGAYRPEKVFLKMIKRYFRSSEIMLATLADKPADYSLYKRMYLAYHQQELQLLPAKLALWGSQINRSDFPDATPANIQGVVTTLDSLSYQIEELTVLRKHPEIESSVVALKTDIREWRLALIKVFTRLADGQLSKDELAARLASRMESITLHAEEIIKHGNVLAAEDRQKIYQLLGGFRRLSQEVIVYAGVAEQVDWPGWRREHF